MARDLHETYTGLLSAESAGGVNQGSIGAPGDPPPPTRRPPEKNSTKCLKVVVKRRKRLVGREGNDIFARK